jgi:hypothetical protein
VGPICQQHPHHFEVGRDQKKKANSQKLGVKNKNKKGNFYSS